VACFFTTPWTTLAPTFAPADQAWLFGESAYYLRALGRLTEEIEPLRAGLKSYAELGDWSNAARLASNLSEWELTRGEISPAVDAGEQSVTFADRSGTDDWLSFVRSRSTLADALHQRGQADKARRLIEDAESRQIAGSSKHSQLYSIRGFRYCNLLLSEAERVAWQRWLVAPDEPSTTHALACEEVIKRAKQTLNWAEHNLGPLNIALDHLTLARATLYKSFLTSSEERKSAVNHIAAAVDNFHKAGQAIYIMSSLLTSAWVQLILDDKPGCQADLDEAWEIAERGPMPLFQADIQLTRARLFRNRAALAEARRLIEKHVYHRRGGELADAEEAALGWEEATSIPASESLKTKPELKSNEDSMRDQVFISYSHRDKKLMEDLLTHLKPHLRSGLTAWSDKQIASGAQWLQEIQDALAKTSVAVLLVSPDFLASDFIDKHELGPLLKEAKAGGVRILWVPLRAAAYEETPLKDYQAVSPPDRPLAQMSRADRDEAWVRVCKEIKRAANP
jgi:hypothetical protein